MPLNGADWNVEFAEYYSKVRFEDDHCVHTSFSACILLIVPPPKKKKKSFLNLFFLYWLTALYLAVKHRHILCYFYLKPVGHPLWCDRNDQLLPLLKFDSGIFDQWVLSHQNVLYAATHKFHVSSLGWANIKWTHCQPECYALLTVTCWGHGVAGLPEILIIRPSGVLLKIIENWQGTVGISSVLWDFGVAPLVEESRTVSSVAAELNVGMTVSAAPCTAER